MTDEWQQAGLQVCDKVREVGGVYVCVREREFHLDELEECLYVNPGR